MRLHHFAIDHVFCNSFLVHSQRSQTIQYARMDLLTTVGDDADDDLRDGKETKERRRRKRTHERNAVVSGRQDQVGRAKSPLQGTSLRNGIGWTIRTFFQPSGPHVRLLFLEQRCAMFFMTPCNVRVNSTSSSCAPRAQATSPYEQGNRRARMFRLRRVLGSL